MSNIRLNRRNESHQPITPIHSVSFYCRLWWMKILLGT